MADPVFPLTIDDTSPVVLYSPFGDTFAAPNTAQGWNPFYTNSGFATLNAGAGSAIGSAIGNGTSLHVTAADGAGLQISWNGTDITLFGTLITLSNDAADATYSVVLDGTATTNFLCSISSSSTLQDAATDVLASFQGLQDGPHTLQLALHNPNGNAGNSTSSDIIVAFDRAVVEVGAGLPNPTASPQPSTSASTPAPSVTAITAPIPDDEIAFRGQWDFESSLLPGVSASFHRSTNIGDKATITFNGSAVGLAGLTTPASGAYNVSLDSGEPVTFSARASFTSSAPTLLFFRSGLDPSVMHIVEVVNAGPSGAGEGAGSLLVLGAVNVTSVQSPGATPIGAVKSSTLSRGAIAAVAIGVTLAVAALAAAIIFFVRRRRRIRRHKHQMLVNPRIKRARSLTFLFPHKRRSQATERDAQKARESGVEAGGVLDIRSATPETQEKHEDSDDSDEGEEGQRFSAAEKGKQRATRRSTTSKNSDGSYSIELPDLTIAQVPRGYLPASAVPSTPSPPGTITSPISPRSPVKPRGPRDLPGRESTRGILLSNLGSTPASPPEGEGLLTVPARPYLPETNISPLRVEFASDVQDRPEGRSERHISIGAMSLPQSLRQALSQQMSQAQASQPSAPPSSTRTSRIYSFLDFSSSSSSSRSQRRSASNSTGKSRSSSRSKRNTGSEQSHNVNWASLPPDRRISLGLSMTVGGGPSASRPSLSPNVSLHPVPLAHPTPTLIIDQEVPSSDAPGHRGPDRQYTYDANQLPSPTDSVPYTVSDIHFRHSTHSSISMPTESRRTSAYRLSGSHRPPHPPLPSAGPSSPTRLMHRRGGSQSGSQSVPPFIVQRILGRAPGSVPGSPYGSPTTFQSAGTSMTGAATAVARSTASPSPTALRPSLPAASTSMSATPSSPAPTATPGSSTTVFGFQLGRLR